MEDIIEKDENFLLNKYSKKYIIQEQIPYIKSNNLINQENNEDLICPICFFILKSPINCSEKKNSHSFCKECIDKYLEGNNACPTCKLNFLYKFNEEIYNNLNKLKFKCEFQNEGCDKIIPYSEYLTHINNCKYNNNLYECNIKKYDCDKKSFEKCGYIGNKIEIEKHFKICAFKINKCSFCNNNILNMDFEEHIEFDCKFGVIKYQNGDIYIGEKNKNIKEGYGIIYYSNGRKYEGEFKNDVADGYGIYYYLDGIKYEGEWKNGLINGLGVFYLINAKYECEIKLSRFKGYGKAYYSDGSIYEGEFGNNIKEGLGICYYSNGSKYEGEYKNNKKNGYGIYSNFNGDIYIGEFKNEYFNGYGIYKYHSGERYEGEWENNSKNGYGIYYYRNKNKYEGEWKNDLRNGYGIIVTTRGSKYEVEFKNGLKDGYGVELHKNGDMVIGEYKNNKINGYGIFYFKNGDKYEGEFKNGRNYGYGTFYSFLGFKYENYFTNGNIDKYLGLIYKIILCFHFLDSSFTKRKMIVISAIIILIIGFVIQKTINECLFYKK